MENDIVERLQDLLKQATTDRSHFYVAKQCKDAIVEITALRDEVAALRAEIRRKALQDLVRIQHELGLDT